MIQRLLAGGLFAGVAAGLLAALLHFAFVQKIILLGEQYESGALVHFGGAEGAQAGQTAPDHDHAAAATTATATETGSDTATAHADGHGSMAAEGVESSLKRNALTVLFFALTYAAYGLILTAAMTAAGHFGIEISPSDGILWGLAGFAAFQLAPAMGLAPELPGTVAADLGARQIWWWGTVLATATGLACLGYGKNFGTAAFGGALLALPHIIGAPQIDGFYGVAPPEVGAAFAARVLGSAMVTWAVLGWLAAGALRPGRA